jgi:hypothetical protein
LARLRASCGFSGACRAYGAPGSCLDYFPALRCCSTKSVRFIYSEEVRRGLHAALMGWRGFGGVGRGTFHQESHGGEKGYGDGHDGDYVTVGECGGLLLQ